MRILTKYVVGELLKLFVLTLSVMTLMMFIGLLGKQAVEQGLGLGALLRLMPYVLPEALQFTLPGALLLAVSGVYGRVASSNELVAVKSMGISPMVMVWPTLILSVLVSFTAVWLNDIAVSWGRRGQERVILESLEAIAYSQLTNKGMFEYRSLKVYVKDVQGRTLVRPQIVIKEKGQEQADILEARSAQFAADIDSGQLILKMEDVDATGEFDFIQPGVAEQELPLDDLLGSREKSRSPSNYALAEIGPGKQQERETIDKARQDMSTEAAFAMLTGDFNELGESNWKNQERTIRNAENRLNRFYTEPYRRWSNGFSCLAFACVGIPVAVMLRKGEMLASFFACFLPILIVYYPMFMGTMVAAKKGNLPPQSVWLGNIVLIIVGLYLMRREVRH
ncbi:LptF/LptG family permease [Aeoliella mucimassa]|uniref:Putative permease YjgP/YjgQ family protein n=1 Tax=Aeoliella mucimassa TaxID=2527972 RepID=A0A518AJ70_9BACT|nr:LptF/LptG family permease [Aeoliella mucimassa]QDU54724.1 putative permease YjgP/YjgQ family protein [Aeoliella mucimassa]